MSACGTCWPAPIRSLLRWVASVIRIASPSPPPTWREVFTRPDASPVCPCLAPCVAAIVEGTIDIAMPAAASRPGIITYTMPLPLEPILLSSSRPPVSITRPPPSTGRTPKWLTSRPVREATSMIVKVIGRKISPVSSGDRPRTCCR